MKFVLIAIMVATTLSTIIFFRDSKCFELLDLDKVLGMFPHDLETLKFDGGRGEI